MNPSRLARRLRSLPAPGHELRWRWRKLRGQTGDFDRPELSERAWALTETWEEKWPGAEPVGYLVREAFPDRWIRFHSLPESKRYAENPAEYAEILRRHRTLLSELQGGPGNENLTVIGTDWGPRDLYSGWSRRHLPGAWPWRKCAAEEHEPGLTYFWVKPDLSTPDLDRLLMLAADDMARLLVTDEGLAWLYCPYDGGADVFLPSSFERNAIGERHSDWLSPHRPGL